MVSSEIVIEALDVRLRRLEFILTGSTDSKTPQNDVSNGGDGGGNIPRQLASLNERLTRLANGNKSIKKLLQACDTQPSLLEPPKPPPAPNTLSEPEKLAIIVPAAPLYHQISSSLISIRDTPFPPEYVSAEIANSLPEVTKLQLEMMKYEEEVKELRGRGLKVLEAWYGLVEGVNGCIEEWDQRLRGVETQIRRREKVLEDEESY